MIKIDTLQVNLYFFSMRLHTGSLTNRPYIYIYIVNVEIKIRSFVQKFCCDNSSYK